MAHALPTLAANLPAWIEAPPKALRRMAVTVHTTGGRRFMYEGLFATTFDGYDDALNRHPNASRIEVEPVTKPGDDHAA